MNGREEKISWVKKVKITIEGHSIEYLTSSSQKSKINKYFGQSEKLSQTREIQGNMMNKCNMNKCILNRIPE